MKRLLVCGAVIEDKGKILIARRAPRGDRGGCWEFPGGKVEDRESLKGCLARELKEELFIDAVIGPFLGEGRYTEGDTHIHLIAFYVRSFTGTFVLHTHSSLKWVPVEELIYLPLSPADVPVAKILLKLLPRK